MSSDKKQWTRPSMSLLDESVFKSWEHDKLQHVRDLVRHALELVEASGQAPDAEARLRAFLDEIDAELAE